ncbi:MAG: FlgD immunoglobulin-like domain containing protein [Methanosarcinaceae archaeon]
MKNRILIFSVVFITLFLRSPVSQAYHPAGEQQLVTSLHLSLQVSEIKIKDKRDVDNDGEFHFWRNMLGKSVRLPQSGDIVRKKNEFIRPADPNLGREPFWAISWDELGTVLRNIKFDGWESDSWPASNDDLGEVGITLDLSTFGFIAENNPRTLENDNYHIVFSVKCAPQIRSNTHPDTNEVYEKSAITLDWKPMMPGIGILGYSYSIDLDAQSSPDAAIEGTYTNVTYRLTASAANQIYWFHIKAQDKAGLWSNTAHFKIKTGKYEVVYPTEIEKKSNSRTRAFQLFQNYPNPFNGETIISYELQFGQKVVVQIYNLTGQIIRTVANQAQAAGRQEVSWDGNDHHGQPVPSGVYFYRIQAGFEIQTRKMTLLR